MATRISTSGPLDGYTTWCVPQLPRYLFNLMRSVGFLSLLARYHTSIGSVKVCWRPHFTRFPLDSRHQYVFLLFLLLIIFIAL